MKKLLLIVFLFSSTDAAVGQNCGTDYLGTKTLYKFQVQIYTPPPEGYKPVFINYVGRHGARHLTKDVKVTSTYTLLLKADSAAALSVQGKKLEQMVMALQKVEQGDTKSITAEGKIELAGIATRIYTNYSNVFDGPSNFIVAFTKEIRTRQSADAFLKGLNSELRDTASLIWNNDDTDLRFYDFSPAYKAFEDSVNNGSVKAAFNKVEHLDELNSAIVSRFFTADFISKSDKNEKEKFVSDLFGFAGIVPSIQAETLKAGFQLADVDIKSFFTCDELNKLALLDNAGNDLMKGPGIDENGIQVRIAVPLLLDFINTTDEFVKGGKYNMRLRFSHAETIAPIAALMQISGADQAGKSLNVLNKVWNSSKVIPLSANLTWVFYQNRSTNELLVKILLNEKEVNITGLKSKLDPYYRWTDLRMFYLNILDKLNVRLNDNMKNYLTDLK